MHNYSLISLYHFIKQRNIQCKYISVVLKNKQTLQELAEEDNNQSGQLVAFRSGGIAVAKTVSRQEASLV